MKAIERVVLQEADLMACIKSGLDSLVGPLLALYHHCMFENINSKQAPATHCSQSFS